MLLRDFHSARSREILRGQRALTVSPNHVGAALCDHQSTRVGVTPKAVRCISLALPPKKTIAIATR